MFWDLLLAFLVSFSVVVISGLIFWKPMVNLYTDAFVKRLMKDHYPENIGEMYNVFKKVGIQNVLEADLRGNNGKALERPFGSPIHFSEWNKLMLNPVYLSRLPIIESVGIDFKVTIGPQAKHPMEIDLPIMIGGMAYGIGPSFNAKLALAKGADQVNTATNTGVGPFLPEERKHTKRLIIQYHRGSWMKDETVFRQADMVEIQLGYGALGSAPVTVRPKDISDDFASYMNLKSDQGLTLNSRLNGVNNLEDLRKLVNYLREITNGVPIGVKIGATHFLEKELDIITKAGVDFIAIDGAEAGINFGPSILADDLGLPTLPALCRSVNYLKKYGLDKKISLIISGGLVTPGQFLKALALGADAVYIGTIAMIVLAHLQLTKVTPWEPPTELVYERGSNKEDLNIDEGAKSIANFLKSCMEEMTLAMRTLGKTSIKEIDISDLSALSPEIANMTGVELAIYSPKNGVN